MALLKNKNTVALFLTAILAMAAVLSSPYLANGEEGDNNCFPWQEEKPCDIQTCNQVCKAHGHPDTDARCGHPPPGKGGDREFCCCSLQQ